MVARLRVYTHGRFIEQNQFRLLNEAGCHVEAALHASRKVLDQLISTVGQGGPIEASGHGLLKYWTAQPVIATERLEVFAAGEPGIERQFLRDPSQRRACGRRIGLRTED